MREYAKTLEPPTRTLIQNPRHSQQNTISEILQNYRNKEITQFCGRRLGSKTTKPIPEKLEYTQSTRATTATVITYEKGASKPIEEKTYTSGGGMHAEEKLVRDIEIGVEKGVYSPGKSFETIISISKSPCTSSGDTPTRGDGAEGCTEILRKAQGSIKGADFHHTVIVTKLYGSSKEKQVASQSALDSLRESGMDVFSPMRPTGKRVPQ